MPAMKKTKLSLFSVLTLFVTGTVTVTLAENKPDAGPAPTTKATAKPMRLMELVPVSPEVILANPLSTARLLVDGKFQDGLRDVTALAAFTVSNPKVAIINDRGIVEAQSVGKATATARVTLNGVTQTCRIPISVTGVTKTPLFTADIMPILTKTGCNAGACHGANAGKGGFHLSLLGYDPKSDYESLTHFIGSRRISLAQPENSLILRKATARIRHGGSMRFSPESSEYRTLQAWIAGGAPAPQDNEPTVKKLLVTPGSRILGLGGTQRYRVEALLSDNSKRDVTARTLFTSGDGAILEVKSDGVAKVVGSGEGAIVIRYGGVFTAARLTAPYGKSFAAKKSESASTIDTLINSKLAALGVPTSERCTDAEYLRRVSLDVTGVLPRPAEVKAFLEDSDPKKREKLVDSLLVSSAYVDFWTLKWSDLLRNSQRSLFPQGMKVFHQWIRKSVKTNKPWDQFTREILTAQGSSFAKGEVNYYRTGTDPELHALLAPEELGETTAQLFMGVRLQCAHCHNHPFEKWTQVQYYQLAGFFGRMEAKNGKETGEQLIGVNNWNEIRHPKTNAVMRAAPLDAPPIPADYKGDRRQFFADWLTAENNPFFANVIVNRLWKHYLGRGLVEPVDDFRVTNPATNDPLLQFLTSDFRAKKYDLKALMREIVLSDAYNRSSRALPGNVLDNRYYSRFLVKRLSAEQILDALNDVAGTSEKFKDYPEGTRAVQLMDTTVASSFLDAFGRPLRQTTCECERSADTSVNQALHLLNGEDIQSKLEAPTGRLAKLCKETPDREALIEQLYLAALTRPPTSEETARALKWFVKRGDVKLAVQDLTWAILNSKEFMFNH